MSQTVSVDVDVDINDFDDAEILMAALDIIEESSVNIDSSNSFLINKIAVAVGVACAADTLPPPSTAAQIKTISDLKQWQRAQIGEAQS